jgi:glycine/D-amino acid oxidase-like deaminating enzyme
MFDAIERRIIASPGSADLPRTADVVIIGGGPAGTAALWAIGRAAPGTRLVLLEKSTSLAAGSSLASLENFRTCWPTPCLAKQMTRSVAVFHHADEVLGDGVKAALAIKQQGYLYCGFTAGQVEGLKRDVAHLHRIGLPHVAFLDADEVAYRYPWLGGRVIGAKVDPIAGWLDSNALVYGYVRGARAARVLLGVEGARIAIRHGRVAGVSTPQGDIAAPNVVIAAGAGSRQVGRTAGIDLPIVLRPRQSFTTPWRHEAFPADAPLVIGARPYPHVRPEARDGAIFAWEYHWNTKQHKEAGTPTRDRLLDPVWPVERLKDPRFPSATLAWLARQFGDASGQGFADGRYLRGVSHNIGYYVYRDRATTYRTDADGTRHPYDSQRALIGPWPGIEGLFLSVAHVGHGIMSSPAAGEIVAAHVLGHDLPDPVFRQFALDVPWVEYDAGGLGG